VSRSEHEHGEAQQQQQVGQHRGHLSREARLFFCGPVLAGLVLPQVGELGLGAQEDES